jgi:hypothetical protein
VASRLLIPAVLQIALPLAMLGWQAAGRDTNIVAWGFKHVAVWSYIYATSIAGIWLLVPWYVPHVLMVVSISLAARTLPGAFRLWRTPDDHRQWLLSSRAAVWPSFAWPRCGWHSKVGHRRRAHLSISDSLSDRGTGCLSSRLHRSTARICQAIS